MVRQRRNADSLCGWYYIGIHIDARRDSLSHKHCNDRQFVLIVSLGGSQDDSIVMMARASPMVHTTLVTDATSTNTIRSHTNSTNITLTNTTSSYSF